MNIPATADRVDSPGDPRLRSELARYSLQSSGGDEDRRLAWANSICALFIVVALAGLRDPASNERPVRNHSGPLPQMPLVMSEPSAPSVVRSEQAPEQTVEPNESQASSIPEPVIVAPAEDVSVPIPISSYVEVTVNPRVIPAPPPILPRRTALAATPSVPTETASVPTYKPIRYGGREFRKQPPPNYPDQFLRNRIGGTVEALISVATNGVPSRVDVGRSSGTPALDRHLCDFILREWRAHPGPAANYRIEITFSP